MTFCTVRTKINRLADSAKFRMVGSREQDEKWTDSVEFGEEAKEQKKKVAGITRENSSSESERAQIQGRSRAVLNSFASTEDE